METAQLRAVLDAIPARIALLDRERRHRYVNQEYAAFLGRPVERILGRTVAQVIGAKAYARIRHLGERALAGETVRWEGWLPYRGKPEMRFVQRVYIPYRAEGDAIDGYFSFSRDLTELKRSEQLLAKQLAASHASEAIARAVTDAALDCVVVVDEAGLVVAFNPAAERTFGYRQAEVIGRPVSELICPPALRGTQADCLHRCLQPDEGRVFGRRFEMEALRSDGGNFPMELAIAEVRLPARRLLTAYLRDLTPAKQAAAEIERQRQALHQNEKLAALGTLLAGVAHELNNPLSIVISNALILEEEVQDGAISDLTGRIVRVRAAAERCARIVRDFLATARRSEVRAELLAPGDLIRRALDPLDQDLLASGIEVRRDVSADLPPVHGDPDRLSQVITHLVVNAQQALENRPPPRRILVAVRRAGARLEILVSDNGPGIPEPLRSRIFDPFFTTKPVGTGMGLGLAASRGTVEAHGGSLLLASPTTTEGTSVVLRLPIAADTLETQGTGTLSHPLPSARTADS